MRRSRRSLSFLAILSLTACGAEETAVTPVEPASPVQPGSDAALPVTAPMAMRGRMLNDLGEQTDAARERERLFDAAVDQNR